MNRIRQIPLVGMNAGGVEPPVMVPVSMSAQCMLERCIGQRGEVYVIVLTFLLSATKDHPETRAVFIVTAVPTAIDVRGTAKYQYSVDIDEQRLAAAVSNHGKEMVERVHSAVCQSAALWMELSSSLLQLGPVVNMNLDITTLLELDAAKLLEDIFQCRGLSVPFTQQPPHGKALPDGVVVRSDIQIDA